MLHADKTKLQAQLDVAREEANELASLENLTEAQAGRLEQLVGDGTNAGEIAELQAQLKRAERIQARFTELSNSFHPDASGQWRGTGGSNGSIQPAMRDSSGRPIFALSKDQKLVDTFDERPQVENGFGEVIRAMITGPNRYTPEPIRNALSTGASTGSFLVPDVLSSEVIDKARAQSRVLQAGARTIRMDAGEVKFAKVVTDPTISAKGENASFTDSDPVFGMVTLNAYTFGTTFAVSREMAQDAPNFGELVSNMCAAKMAQMLDYFAIQGSGSAEPVGLTINSEISETGSVGGLAWEDLASAASEVRQNNHEPTGIILGVEPHEDLMISTTSSNDATASKTWLLAPPALEGQNLYPTMNCPLAFALCGDWSKLFWGVRSGIMVEFSNEAGEAFRRHQTLVKCTFRGDTVLSDSSAMHRLAGITS